MSKINLKLVKKDLTKVQCKGLILSAAFATTVADNEHVWWLFLNQASLKSLHHRGILDEQYELNESGREIAKALFKEDSGQSFEEARKAVQERKVENAKKIKKEQEHLRDIQARYKRVSQRLGIKLSFPEKLHHCQYSIQQIEITDQDARELLKCV